MAKPTSNGLVIHVSSLNDRSTEVVMCTSSNDRTTITDAIALGAKHYIVKPCTPEIVAAKLKQIEGAKATADTGPSARFRPRSTDQRAKRSERWVRCRTAWPAKISV